MKQSTFVTTLTPQDFATAITKELGFVYQETTSFATFYRERTTWNMLAIAEPTAEVYETLEVWADCRFTPEQMDILKIRFSTDPH